MTKIMTNQLSRIFVLLPYFCLLATAAGAQDGTHWRYGIANGGHYQGYDGPAIYGDFVTTDPTDKRPAVMCCGYVYKKGAAGNNCHFIKPFEECGTEKGKGGGIVACGRGSWECLENNGIGQCRNKDETKGSLKDLFAKCNKVPG